MASSLLPQQILNFLQIFSLTSIRPKNSLELPNPTRNIRKCSNKLMANTSGEINSQSKQDITDRHVPGPGFVSISPASLLALILFI